MSVNLTLKQMRKDHQKKCIPPFLTVATSFFLLANLGCSRVNRVHFQEEVMLHDGRIIVIDREASRHPNGFPDSRRGALISAKWMYPAGNVWLESPDDKFESFDYVNGSYYIATSTPDYFYCLQHGRDAPYLQVKRWSGRQWVDVELEKSPIGEMTSNLSRRYWGNSSEQDQKGLLTWAEKVDINSDRYMNVPIRLQDEYKKRGAPYPMQIYLDREYGLTCGQALPSAFGK